MFARSTLKPQGIKIGVDQTRFSIQRSPAPRKRWRGFRPAQRIRGNANRRRGDSLTQSVSGKLFLDTGGLTATLTQVVQLGLAHVTATLHFDRVDQRAVSLEGTLNANTMRNFTYGESGVEATVTLANDYTVKSLQTLAGTLTHLDLYDNGIARGKFRYRLAHLLGFKRLDHLVLAAHVLLLVLGAAPTPAGRGSA